MTPQKKQQKTKKNGEALPKSSKFLQKQKRQIQRSFTKKTQKKHLNLEILQDKKNKNK